MVLKLFSDHNLTISFPPFLCLIHSCVSEEGGRNKETRTDTCTRTHRDRGREREGRKREEKREERRERARPSEQASVHVNRCSYGIVHLQKSKNNSYRVGSLLPILVIWELTQILRPAVRTALTAEPSH